MGSVALSLVAMETLHSSFSFLGCCDKQGLVLHVLSVEHVLILSSEHRLLRTLTEIKGPTPVVEWYSSNRHGTALS